MKLKSAALCCALALTIAPAPFAASAGAQDAPLASPALQAAVQGAWRTPANVARDRYRHPLETLAFFGVKPTDTVIEITPGTGWYSEILAPYLRDQGHYVAAVTDPAALPEARRAGAQRGWGSLQVLFDGNPEVFGKPAISGYDPAAPRFGKDASADVILTFRNVHNWRMASQAEDMFKGFFDVLKPGGTLGVVEHRAKADVPADDRSGYVGVAQVIALAEAAGFTLAAESEVNANPLDTKDYPGGVWTLPPTNRHDAADAAKYQAIGESDRMTLRFVKPAP